MKIEKFEVNGYVWFEIWTLDNPFCEFKPALSINYINESSDHWHSDRKVDIDISVEQAKEMIEFLQDFVEKVEK